MSHLQLWFELEFGILKAILSLIAGSQHVQSHWERTRWSCAAAVMSCYFSLSKTAHPLIVNHEQLHCQFCRIIWAKMKNIHSPTSKVESCACVTAFSSDVKAMLRHFWSVKTLITAWLLLETTVTIFYHWLWPFSCLLVPPCFWGNRLCFHHKHWNPCLPKASFKGTHN